MEKGQVYNFYGWQTAAVTPVDPRYSLIKNPRVLYDYLAQIWCAETCAPRLRGNWIPENRTLGQCSITAFLAQDIFGGRVYGVPMGDGNFHCYNVIGDCIFDLTSEQFGNERLCYENNPEQFREIHFAKEEKRQRYEYLRAQLLKVATVKIHGLYRHFKGNYYLVEDVAWHSETKEEYVVYRKLYGDNSLWIREKGMFLSEVDHDKYPEIQQKYRFEQVDALPVKKEVTLEKDR